jgi:hypothetical protein
MAKRKTAAQWRRFLQTLGRTGNARVAAAAAGMDVATAYDRRIKYAGFAAQWEAALAKAKARPPSRKAMADKGPELVLRRTKHGDKLVRAAQGRWCRRVEELFFAELGRTGCVRSAAAAAGISTNALYYRRDKYPQFAEEWRAVEAAAGERLPSLLRAASIASLDPEVTARGLPKVNVDQAIAISRLKGPGREKPGGHGMRGGIRNSRPAMSREELIEDLVKKLGILKRRRRAKKIAEGWTESEEGHMVPPGWVRGGQEEGDG